MQQDPLAPLPMNSPTPTGMGSADAGQFNQINPLRILRQHLMLFVGTTVVGVVLGVIVWFALLKIHPQYETKVVMVVSGGLTEAYGAPVEAGSFTQQMDRIDAFITNEITRIKSEGLLSFALKPQHIRETDWYKQYDDPRVALEKLQAQLMVGQPRGSTLIDARMRSKYPEDAQKILKEVVDLYWETVKKGSDDRTDQLLKEIQDQRTTVASTIEDDRRRLKSHADLHGLTNVNLDTLGSEAQYDFKVTSEEMAKLRLELEVRTKILEMLKQAQATGEVIASPEDMAEVELDPGIQKRNEQLRTLWEQRQVLLHRFGENHREVKQLDRLNTAIEQKKQAEVDRLLRERQAVKLDLASSAVDALGGQMEALEPQLDGARTRMKDLVDQIQRYRVIQSELNSKLADLNRLDETINELKITKRRSDRIRIEEPGDPTEAELVSPIVYVVTPMVTILALALVAGLVVLRELIDQRIKSPADVKNIPNSRLLGVIPDADEDPSSPKGLENAVTKDPHGLLAESFRRLRSDLMRQMDKMSLKTLLMVGPQPNTGVSVVTQNLATSIAMQGRKVLVIDANLRRPTMHGLFETPAAPGLVEVLTGSAKFEDATALSGDSNVTVLSAGNCDSAVPELLEMPAMSQLLEQVKPDYDVVLIDSPPALLTSDAGSIARHVDSVAIISRAISDKRGMVSRTMAQFRDQQAVVLGVILNGVRSNVGGYFRENYQAFYKYRGASGKTPA